MNPATHPGNPGQLFAAVESPARPGPGGIEIGRWLYWLDHWPLLRHFVLETRFRRICVLLVAATSLIAGTLPKSIPITSTDGSSRIRISVLEFLQAHSLAHTARRAAARKDERLALWAWKASLLRHPGSIRNLEDSLAWARRQFRRDPAATALALHHGALLLSLRGTNDATLIQVVPAWYDLGLDDAILQVAHGTPGPDAAAWPDLARRWLVRARLRSGQFEPPMDPARFEPGPEPAFVECLRIVAHFGSTGSTPPGPKLIEQALTHPTEGTYLAAVLLRAACRHHHPSVALRCLERLEREHRSTPADHVACWRALAATGELHRARTLAENFARPPIHAREAVILGQVYVDLGLDDHARWFLEHHEQEFQQTSELWILHAGLLIRKSRWDEVRLLAARLRTTSAGQVGLRGFAFWLDGLAARANGRHSRAEQLFIEALEAPAPDPRISRLIARGVPPSLAAAHGKPAAN